MDMPNVRTVLYPCNKHEYVDVSSPLMSSFSGLPGDLTIRVLDCTYFTIDSQMKTVFKQYLFYFHSNNYLFYKLATTICQMFAHDKLLIYTRFRITIMNTSF